MTTLLAEVVSKLVSTAEAVSNLKLVAEQRSKLVLSEVVQTSKLSAQFVTGLFYRILEKLFTDSYTVSDTSKVGFNKNVSETVTVQDSIKTVRDAGVKPVDSLNITDDINGAALGDDQAITFFKILTDQYSVSEKIETGFNKVSTDSYTVDDAKLITVGKKTTDSLTVNDDIAKIVTQFSRSFTTDQFNLGDDPKLTVEFFRNFAHEFLISDSVSVINEKRKFLIDEFNLTELISAGFGKNLFDQTTISEAVTVLLDKVSQDTLTLAVSGKVLNQNYISGSDYFQEDYVGVSRTIA